MSNTYTTTTITITYSALADESDRISLCFYNIKIVLKFLFLLTVQISPSLSWQTTTRTNVGTSSTKISSCLYLNNISRRDAMATAAAGLTAEVTWRNFVHAAASAIENNDKDILMKYGELPPGTLEKIEAGKAAIIPNWLTPEETKAICQDAKECFQGGHFKNFILSRNPKKADKAANDRWIMPSFAYSKGTDGPFVDRNVGDFQLRQSLKEKMAMVKAALARGLTDRPTLANDLAQTHEMEYLRYGVGALLNRHVDEHHLELKRPHGSKLPLKENASRRSITWLIYLNDDWKEKDGGQLRLHERVYDSVSAVGARRNDLQVGWLKANPSKGLKEQPVFLDPSRDGPENETCMLYTFDDANNGNKRDLSQKPFANLALYLAGGDALARRLMVDNPVDAERFHLIDQPKSLVSTIVKSDPGFKGEDGGEQVKDILPRAGTLVLFDSVTLPHEVLQTNRERFGVQGWFHEHIYTSADA